MKRNFISIFCLLILSIVSCSSDDDSSTNSKSRVSIKLIDAPGDFDNVFIDVESVVIKYNDLNEDDTEFVNVNSGVYDLLTLTGGASVILVDEEIPAGRISQIRLILGNDNTVVVDGQSFALDTPSAQQSGLKLNVNQEVEGGVFYEFILDFDADRSIVQRGNGSYGLMPVIRAELVAETGAISGSINPSNFQTLVTATNNLVTINTYANSSGEYTLSGVPEGTYTISIVPETDSQLSPVIIDNVEVNVGQVTNLGLTELN